MNKISTNLAFASFLFKNDLQTNSKIWSDPAPRIILSKSKLNFLAKLFLNNIPSESGYLMKVLEPLIYSRIALGLGPRAHSFADNLILTFFF